MARRKVWTEEEMAEAFPLGTPVRWTGHTGYFTVKGYWANAVTLYGGSLSPDGVRMFRYARPNELTIDKRPGRKRAPELLVAQHKAKKKAVRKPRSTMTKRGS